MKKHWYLPIGLALVAAAMVTLLKPDAEKPLPAQKDLPTIHREDSLTKMQSQDSIAPHGKLRKDLPVSEALKYARSAGKSNNQFAEALTRLYLKNYKNENIFFSPFSISSALSMTGEGAKGETQQQILDVFHLSGADSVRKYGILGLYEILNKKSSYKLNTSNALWIQQGAKLSEDFMSSAKDFYRADVEFLNFANTVKSSHTINQYVEKKTENRIKNLIAPEMINADTRLVLTNTIYFKADWKQKFDAEDTYNEYFNTGKGESKPVDMMRQKNVFNYFENESFQALEMEYQDGDMSMIVILPQSEDANSIAQINLDKAMNVNFKREEVRVSFPKFKIETSYSLKDDLSRLGMPLAFNDADFSGISDVPMKISAVVHKAFVEVGEKGTEAAAATAVVAIATSVAPMQEKPVKTFTADHPFIFMIRHNQTGAVLFMGVVNNPGKGG